MASLSLDQVQNFIDSRIDFSYYNNPCRYKTHFTACQNVKIEADSLQVEIENMRRSPSRTIEDALLFHIESYLKCCLNNYELIDMPFKEENKSNFANSVSYTYLLNYMKFKKNDYFNSNMNYNLLKNALRQVKYHLTSDILKSISVDDFRFDTTWVVTIPEKTTIKKYENYYADMNFVSSISSPFYAKMDRAIVGRKFDEDSNKFVGDVDTFYFKKKSIKLKLKPYQSGINTYWVQYLAAKTNCGMGYSYFGVNTIVKFNVEE
jgi:hypothetical protein